MVIAVSFYGFLNWVNDLSFFKTIINNLIFERVLSELFINLNDILEMSKYIKFIRAEKGFQRMLRKWYMLPLLIMTYLHGVLQYIKREC